MKLFLKSAGYLYNRLLQQRKYAWEIQEASLDYRIQQKILPAIKTARNLHLAHSQVLQNVAVRVDLAFKAFFRRVKAGEKPGYPRFKGKGWYDSITFPQVPSGCRLKEGRLAVSKVGHIKIVVHREVCGKLKSATIRRSSTGKWSTREVRWPLRNPRIPAGEMGPQVRLLRGHGGAVANRAHPSQSQWRQPSHQ